MDSCQGSSFPPQETLSLTLNHDVNSSLEELEIFHQDDDPYEDWQIDIHVDAPISSSFVIRNFCSDSCKVSLFGLNQYSFKPVSEEEISFIRKFKKNHRFGFDQSLPIFNSEFQRGNYIICEGRFEMMQNNDVYFFKFVGQELMLCGCSIDATEAKDAIYFQTSEISEFWEIFNLVGCNSTVHLEIDAFSCRM